MALVTPPAPLPPPQWQSHEKFPFFWITPLCSTEPIWYSIPNTKSALSIDLKLLLYFVSGDEQRLGIAL